MPDTRATHGRQDTADRLSTQPAVAKRGPRLRTIVPVLVAGGAILCLGTFFVVGDSHAWGSWLTTLQFSGKQPSHAKRSRKSLVKDPAKLHYFGDGRAELGDFSIRIFDPISRNTLRSDFRLEGCTVFGNKKSFLAFMKNNQRLFREQIMVVMRSCNPDELADSDLNLLEKKLVSRVNRALGRRFLKSVQMRDYKVYESAENVFVPVEASADKIDG